MRPLTGTRILDLSQYVPGSFCTMICRRLGADVVKVERPTSGDPLRSIDAGAFDTLNAGKRSICCDLKRPDGLALVLSLIARADILVESFRPGVMDRLGLSYGQLRSTHPGLIYVSISGFGQVGRLASRAGHDLNYLALGGALGERPSVPAIQIADYAGGGLYATVALLAALMERRTTGEGRHLDISMSEGVCSFNALAQVEMLSGSMPSYGCYETSDGKWLSLGAVEPKFWVELCEAIGRPDLGSRHGDPSAKPELDAIFGRRSLDEWMRLLADRDVCVMPVVARGSPLHEGYVAERGRSASERPWLGINELDTPASALGADEQSVRRDWDVDPLTRADEP